MFHPEPSLSSVAAARPQVVTLVESINQPQISIPAKPPQAAQAYLCGLHQDEGSYEIFAVLYLVQSAENVVYVHEPRRLTAAGYVKAEAEGLQFLESMGFMLDNLNFRGMPADQQQQTMERVRAFTAPAAASSAAAPAGPSAAAAALARLLASL